MKKLELTKEHCDMLSKCIKHRIDYLHETNRVFLSGSFDDDVADKCAQNIVAIGKLKTLLDYINS